MSLREGSLAHTLAGLQIGQCYSRSEMMGLSAPGMEEKVKAAKTRMKNHLNKHADRASKTNGSIYRLDSGVWLANEDAAVFVTVNITRMA